MAKGVNAVRESSTLRTDNSKVGAGAQMVAVLDKNGRPLMPCHPARARKLLARGRAVIVQSIPFAIRLKDRVAEDSDVSTVSVRIDPGSKGTGIAVTTDVEHIDPAMGEVTTSRRGLLAVELRHRGSQVHGSMQQRANYRRRRRSANLRYRAPRFSNRSRPAGWLAPSLQHRVDTTMSIVTRLMMLFPVTELHLERAAFDTHALSLGREDLNGVEYQQGALAGYEVRQYLLEKWGRTCAYCGAKNVPLQIDHIRPRARGGSDRVSNLTLACGPCNQAKDARPVEEFLAGKPARLARLLAQAQAPLGDAAAMNATRWQLWQALKSPGLPVSAWSGGRTKYNRAVQGLAKSHTLDALAVGEISTSTRIVRHPDMVLVTSACGRGSYARTRTDKHGFPRLYLPRQKQHYGFSTGDLVRADIPRGKYQGTYTGRVAVRASGTHRIPVPGGYADTHHSNLRLLQRGDGYAYTTRKEDARL
ncbi:RNA-guided endonuclease IscB [Streptomyces chiangmaiensis]|uniref:RNA-guided endonuclease IscB n=1 Tax=Streptomyces chiangmaiensis TaxID=766497 RepID=A0ABU7F9V7_9ACTN|nr:RNA-guided endonuclease IscB [Streptomyces chiangmaiensis]MED7820904.1 RNA-guided endonuclease IscB [Streptomyces chiangmaiensis]